MSVIDLREPEDICPTEFLEDQHHDCKETIDDLQKEIKRLHRTIGEKDNELIQLRKKLRLINARKYFTDNKCIWAVDRVRCNGQQAMCSESFMPDNPKRQYYDVDHNPITHDYYDKPIYKCTKWPSGEYDTLTAPKESKEGAKE